MKNRLRPALIALAVSSIVGVGVLGEAAASAALAAALSDVGTSHTVSSAMPLEHGSW